VTEIADRFAVSKMTGHRDLKFLERRGAVKRIFGGALPGERKNGSPLPSPAGEAVGQHALCTICRRPAQPHLRYVLNLANGESRLACCPHCGISAHLVLRDQVAEAQASDNLSGRRHPAQQSMFLLGSSSIPCCRPSILTFEDEVVARRFQAGFGGTLGRLEDAMNFLLESMSAGGETGCPHCAAR
jgi:hypothetical protein